MLSHLNTILNEIFAQTLESKLGHYLVLYSILRHLSEYIFLLNEVTILWVLESAFLRLHEDIYDI